MAGLEAIIRDAPFGQLIRYVTNNRVLKYPEELDDFECPYGYGKQDTSSAGAVDTATTLAVPAHVDEPNEIGKTTGADLEKVAAPPDLEISPSHTAEPSPADSSSASNSHLRHIPSAPPSSLQRVHTLPYSQDRLASDLQAHRTRSAPTHVLAPTKTSDGLILVNWYSTSDSENPQNWSAARKAWTAFLVCAYTFVVYASSSIYVSSVELVRERFGVGEFKAGLGLALYVLGYGIGPLVFAPLSEVPAFGRNLPYVATFAIFVILAIPASLVDTFGGLLTLRFLLGFFGSPCLANGGASMGDIYSLLYLPYPLAMWVVAAFAAPALGPLLSGFSVYAENWRWSQWEILWMSAPVFVLFFFFLPETQPTTILLRRAERLRRRTGNAYIRTQTEVERRGVRFSAVLRHAIVKPIEICVTDPAILFVNLYTALTYGIYYSFFEVFALVYPPIYGFNVGETALVFVCIIVGCFVAVAIHFSYLHWYLIPDILKNGLRQQEHRLVPAIFASVGPPIGLFLFGWTARASIHWIASVVGITIYAASCFILLQCIFTYVPMSYPKYAASLFAGNDFFRSLFAFGAVLFSRPMYVDMGIGKGISILGGLSIIGIIGIYALWVYGAKLRARSKFAE